MQAGVPNGFTTAEMIGIAAVSVVVVGWLVGAIGSLLKHDRMLVSKQDDETNRQILALWKSHDEIKAELNTARRELAVIDDRLQATMPDHHHWDQKLEAVRNQLETKLDKVLSELKQTQIQLATLSRE